MIFAGEGVKLNNIGIITPPPSYNGCYYGTLDILCLVHIHM